MRRLLALALVSALACRDDGVAPVVSPPLNGSYHLTAIDGNALPFSVSMNGQATPVTDGYLELGTSPNLITVGLTLGAVGNSGARAIALAGFYRRVTADSVVFPVIPAPELFLRRTGSTVILVSESTGAGFGAAHSLGGSHRFTFVEDP